MSNRFFFDGSISGERVSLTGAEAHHLMRVMRARPGSRVVLFNGDGDEYSASVADVGRSGVHLSILSREHVNRELPFDLTLGVALPKGDRQKWLVEKTVELGVTRIVPLYTQRSVARPAVQSLARLRRTVIEASKQCGRNRLLQIDAPRSWTDFVADAAGASCRFLAQPQSAHDGLCPLASLDFSQGAFLAVGPEGGFTDEEAALAMDGGWSAVDLGPRILRVETAALLLAAIVGAWGSGSNDAG